MKNMCKRLKKRLIPNLPKRYFQLKKYIFTFFWWHVTIFFNPPPCHLFTFPNKKYTTVLSKLSTISSKLNTIMESNKRNQLIIWKFLWHCSQYKYTEENIWNCLVQIINRLFWKKVYKFEPRVTFRACRNISQVYQVRATEPTRIEDLVVNGVGLQRSLHADK